MRNESFEAYYRRLYGGRWENLRKCLIEDRPACPFSEGLRLPYYLDYASVLAARSLRLPEEPGLVLDACAAPGGKSLVIAAGLPPGAALLANELSADRRRRLRDVLDKHLEPQRREQVRISGFNAAAQGRRKSEHCRFAAILLDAPCSSEAHVLRDQRALAAWTPARPRSLARRQWALLSAAFLLLSPGGSLVYATCALTPEENDGVAQRLLDKYPAAGGGAKLDPPDFAEGEPTAFGRIMLPDRGGIGPLYVARFSKAAARSAAAGEFAHW